MNNNTRDGRGTNSPLPAYLTVPKKEETGKDCKSFGY